MTVNANATTRCARGDGAELGDAAGADVVAPGVGDTDAFDADDDPPDGNPAADGGAGGELPWSDNAVAAPTPPTPSTISPASTGEAHRPG